MRRLTAVTGVLGLVFPGFFIWGIRSGQFHNVEGAKYQVFRKQKQTDDKEEDNSTPLISPLSFPVGTKE